MKHFLRSFRKLSLVLSAFFLLTFSAKAQLARNTYEIGKIAAVVKDHIISMVDLNHRIKLAMLSSGLEDTPETYEKLKKNVLNTMIDEVLQLSTAIEYDLKPTDVEIQNSFDELENRNSMQPGQLKKLLQENGIPLEIIQRQLQASLGWREYIQARYGNSVQIHEQEIQRALKQFEVKKDQPQILIAEIFLSLEGDVKEAEVAKQAAEFVQEIRKGAPFPALAQQFSQSASAARGGDIGWVTEGQLDPVLAQGVSALKINEISDPIKTPNGYYILYLRDRRAPGESIGKDTLLSFSQIVFPVSQPFSDEKLMPVFEKAKKLRTHAKSCGLLQTLIKGDKSIQVREVKKAQASELVPQLRSLLMSLKINEASEPILSDMGFIMFLLCAKEDVNPDNPTPQEVQNRLVEQKLDNLARRELRNLRRFAHIDIRP